MKKIIGLFAVALLISLTINAQKKQGNFKKGNEFTTEQTATLQAKKMTLNLDLNTNQQSEVYNLMKQNAEAHKKAKADFKQKKQDGIQLTSDEKFELQKKRLDKQIEHKAAMKKILSKDQFEKWEKLANKNRKQRGSAMRNKKQMKKGKVKTA
jgi:preprotein translocase subunit SecF